LDRKVETNRNQSSLPNRARRTSVPISPSVPQIYIATQPNTKLLMSEISELIVQFFKSCSLPTSSMSYLHGGLARGREVRVLLVRTRRRVRFRLVEAQTPLVSCPQMQKLQLESSFPSLLTWLPQSCSSSSRVEIGGRRHRIKILGRMLLMTPTASLN